MDVDIFLVRAGQEITEQDNTKEAELRVFTDYILHILYCRLLLNALLVAVNAEVTT